MSDKYILDGRTPVPCDLLTWAKWFETAERHVAKDVMGDVTVSTIFLGLDHNWGGRGPPVLFETMIFGGPQNEYCERCSTWEQAEAMHKTALKLVKGD